jgi:hypothetical protein
MNSEASARWRIVIGLIACVPLAAFVADRWVDWIYPSFIGGAYADFKVYPHGLFLPANLIAFVLQTTGASDAVFRRAMVVEAFLICYSVMLVLFLIIASVFRARGKRTANKSVELTESAPRPP